MPAQQDENPVNRRGLNCEIAALFTVHPKSEYCKTSVNGEVSRSIQINCIIAQSCAARKRAKARGYPGLRHYAISS